MSYPDGKSPRAIEKLNKKLRDHNRAARRREKRLDAMTPEERARHEDWQRTHRPGSASARSAERARRKASAEARELFGAIEDSPPRPADPELEALEAERRDLERLRDELQAALADPYDQQPIGAFE